MSRNVLIRASALFGFFAVLFGAFGAHALKTILISHNTETIWATAVIYHLIHSIASLWAAERRPMTAKLWLVGILFFSGSLYILALTGIHWLGAITPIGGFLFLVGWLMLAVKGIEL